MSERAKVLEDLYRSYLASSRDVWGRMLRNVGFLRGQQWTKVTTLDTGLTPIVNTAKEIRVVRNLVKRGFLMWTYHALLNDPVFQAIGASSDYADSEAATAATTLLRYIRRVHGWKEAERQAFLWMMISGAGYIEPVWRNLPRKVKRTKYTYTKEPFIEDGLLTNRKKQEETVSLQDFGFNVYSQGQVYTYPESVTAWNQVEGVLTVDVITRESAELMLGKRLPGDVKAVSDGDVALHRLSMVHRQALSLSRENPVAREIVGDMDLYQLLVWRRKPTLSRENGQYVVSVGGKIIFDGDLPEIDCAREIDPVDSHGLSLGIIPLYAEHPVESVTVPALMDSWIEPQVRLNKVLTRRDRTNAAHAAARAVVSSNAMPDDVAQRIGAVAGDGQNPVVAMLPQNYMPGIEKEIEDAETTLWDAMGWPNILRGVNPQGVRSASAAEMLRQDASATIASVVTMRELCHAGVARMVLAMARKYYPDEKIVEIIGRESSWLARQFNFADLNVDLELREGSAMPRNRGLRQGLIAEFGAKGLLVDENGKLDRQLVLDALETARELPDTDAKREQVLWARRENEQMLAGMVVQPTQHEDHATHLFEHLRLCARIEYADADPSIQSIVQAHIEGTKIEMSAGMQPPSAPVGLMPTGQMPQLEA